MGAKASQRNAVIQDDGGHALLAQVRLEGSSSYLERPGPFHADVGSTVSRNDWSAWYATLLFGSFL